MPNRMLRDWTQSDKIDELSADAERLFTRLIMKADDYGGFWADTRLLKANLFPLKLDKIREADLLRWMAECQKAGLIVLYEVNQKKYLQIKDFRQRLDKAKAKFPLPPENIESLTTSTEFPAEQNGSRIRTEPERPNGLVVAGATPPVNVNAIKAEYENLVKQLTGKDLTTVWNGLREFIETKKPPICDPYRDAWNLFADKYKLSKVELINDQRMKKIKTRVDEFGFDFFKVLDKIKVSNHLLGKSGDWKVSFDWILENQSNYTKIIEGNYDN